MIDLSETLKLKRGFEPGCVELTCSCGEWIELSDCEEYTCTCGQVYSTEPDYRITVYAGAEYVDTI